MVRPLVYAAAIALLYYIVLSLLATRFLSVERYVTIGIFAAIMIAYGAVLWIYRKKTN